MCSIVNLEGNHSAWFSSRLNCCSSTSLNRLQCVYCMLICLCMTISRSYIANSKGLAMSMSFLFSSSSLTVSPGELFCLFLSSYFDCNSAFNCFFVFGDTLVEVIHDSRSIYFSHRKQYCASCNVVVQHCKMATVKDNRIEMHFITTRKDLSDGHIWVKSKDHHHVVFRNAGVDM